MADGYVEQIDQQAKIIADCVNALERYAEPTNWNMDDNGDSCFNAYLNDDEESEGQGWIGGHLARETLAKVEEMIGE